MVLTQYGLCMHQCLPRLKKVSLYASFCFNTETYVFFLFYCFIQYKRWRSEAFLWEIRNNAEFCCVAYTIVKVHFIICGYSVKSQHFIWTNKDFRIFHLLLKKKTLCDFVLVNKFKAYIIVCLKIFMQHTWTIFYTKAHTC